LHRSLGTAFLATDSQVDRIGPWNTTFKSTDSRVAGIGLAECVVPVSARSASRLRSEMHFHQQTAKSLASVSRKWVRGSNSQVARICLLGTYSQPHTAKSLTLVSRKCVFPTTAKSLTLVSRKCVFHTTAKSLTSGGWSGSRKWGSGRRVVGIKSQGSASRSTNSWERRQSSRSAESVNVAGMKYLQVPGIIP
jgi:hypothetical protein